MGCEIVEVLSRPLNDGRESALLKFDGLQVVG